MSCYYYDDYDDDDDTYTVVQWHRIVETLLYNVYVAVQIQFFITLTHSLYSLHIECDFPAWGQYLLSGYMLLMLTLFTNFYIHAYIMKRRHDQTGDIGQDNGLKIDLSTGDYTNGVIADNRGLGVNKKKA